MLLIGGYNVTLFLPNSFISNIPNLQIPLTACIICNAAFNINTCYHVRWHKYFHAGIYFVRMRIGMRIRPFDWLIYGVKENRKTKTCKNKNIRAQKCASLAFFLIFFFLIDIFYWNFANSSSSKFGRDVLLKWIWICENFQEKVFPIAEEGFLKTNSSI